MKRRTLRNKLLGWLLLYLGLLTLVVFSAANYVHERAEHAVWRALLNSELDSVLANKRTDPDYRWQDSDTLHFCPCEVTGSGFSCIVGLQRGTNLPIAPEQKVNKLWAANKWLLGHEANTGLIERGAFPGIYGENWKINPIR